MNSVFERKFNLRASDFDCYVRMTPSAILDLFQEVAGAHAEELGIGFHPLIEKKMLWVIVRAKYTVIKQPEIHTSVTVKTWPLPPTRLGFRREYLIEDLDGNTLIKGTSDWVLMHSEERKLIPCGDIYPKGYIFCGDKNFEEKTARLRDFEADSGTFTVIPAFCDLDMNGHVNNTKYANFVLNSLNLNRNEVIETFQTDYHHEVKRDTALNIHIKRDGKEILAKGTDTGGENMFFSKITLK